MVRQTARTKLEKGKPKEMIDIHRCPRCKEEVFCRCGDNYATWYVCVDCDLAFDMEDKETND
jgi:hypothetical protein